MQLVFFLFHMVCKLKVTRVWLHKCSIKIHMANAGKCFWLSCGAKMLWSQVHFFLSRISEQSAKFILNYGTHILSSREQADSGFQSETHSVSVHERVLFTLHVFFVKKIIVKSQIIRRTI